MINKPISISAVIPTFKNAAGAINTATALSRQYLPLGVSLEILIVDDGSGDDSTNLVKSRFPSTARLICHKTNRGRSASRNTGAAASRGEYLLFVDADALPADTTFLAMYCDSIKAGANLVFGTYVTTVEDFWPRYESLAQKRNHARFSDGVHYALSSRNFLIERKLFEACGSFDSRYIRYGFEDRDLFIRALSKDARPAIATQAVVSHNSVTTLITVMRKMYEAGCYTSHIFDNDHPDAYRQLGYRTLDARYHPILAAVVSPLITIAYAVSNFVEKLLQSEWIPFHIRVALVKIFAGLSYLAGTRQSIRMGDSSS